MWTWGDVLQILVTLLPYSLGFTIPMALLVGVLMGLGRLSGDREVVAMQACGISVFRILTPLLLLATLAAAIDCYILTEAVPNANRRFRETVFRVSANRAEGEIKPRVFQVDRFPRAVLYVREVAPGRLEGRLPRGRRAAGTTRRLRRRMGSRRGGRGSAAPLPSR